MGNFSYTNENNDLGDEIRIGKGSFGALSPPQISPKHFRQNSGGDRHPFFTLGCVFRLGFLGLG